MLLFFLRHLPTTVIVSLAVPASLLVTLGAMYFLGLTLNILTMMGMLLAIGMLVDNSVVITESIFRHRQLHPGRPLESTLAGVKEVGVATLAGTFSMIIVFLPLVFGEKNEMSIFLVHVAVPIVVAMLASLVIAQTLLPMLAARMSPPPQIAGRLVVRPAAGPLRSARSTGPCRTARPWALITLLIVLSPVPLFALKLAKVDPFPQEASRVLMISLPHRGLAPDDPRRGSGAPHRGLHRGEQGAIRRRDLLLGLAQRRGEHAPVPDAQGRGQGRRPRRSWSACSRTCRRSSSASRASRSTTSARGATLVQPAAGRRIDRAARGHLDATSRTGSSSVEGLEAVRSEAGTGEQEVQVIVNRDRASQLGPHDAGRGDDRRRRDARRPPARTAHVRARTDDAPRVPRIRPPVGGGPRARPGHAARRLAHRTRRRRRFRRPAERPRNPAPQPPDDGRHQREPGRGHDHGRGAQARRADHERVSAAAGLFVEVRPRLRGERQGDADHGAEHAARGRADLPRHGLAVRVGALPAVDHHLDRVRDRGLDLVPRADRHDDHDDGHDRLHGADRRRGQHRHRADRARDRPARTPGCRGTTRSCRPDATACARS